MEQQLREPSDFHAITAALSAALVFTIIMLASPDSAMAQVEWKDRYVTIAKLDQRNPQAAMPADDSCTVVVWQHMNGNGDWDIYAQKVDNSFGLARWLNDEGTFDGILICGAEGDQINPRAAYDSSGGVIVVWEDYRDDANGQVAQIYAQRILHHQGMVDPAWPSDGLAIAANNAHQERPRMIGACDGAYIIWTDWRNDPGTPPTYNRDVYLQYILTNGNRQNNWPATGINVSSYPAHDQINPELSLNYRQIDMGGGNYRTGVTVVYQDNREVSRSSGQVIWTVWLSDFEADGTANYQDVRVADWNEEQINPRVIVTGRNSDRLYAHPIIVWQDARDWANNSWDIYAQRLDENGNNTAYPSVGINVCDMPEAQFNPVMTMWELSMPPNVYEPYACIAWEDHRNGEGVYAGLLDVHNGVISSPNGTDGEEICTLSLTNDQLSIDNFTTAITVDTVYIAWRHDPSTGTNIRYQGIEIPSWTLLKASDGIPVSEAKNAQNLPRVCGRVFVWEDLRRDGQCSQDADYNIYCQTPGECVGPKEMDWRDVFVKWHPGNHADDKKMAMDAEHNTFIAWSEIREGTQSVFVQKFDSDGVPRWRNNGVRISAAGVTASRPDIVADENGGAVVVWQQEDSGKMKNEVYFAQLECFGEIAEDNGVQRTGRFANDSERNDDDADPVIIRTTAAVPGTGYQIAFLRYDGLNSYREHAYISEPVPAGDAYDANTIGSANNPVYDHYNLKMVSDGSSGAWVVTNMPGPTPGTQGQMNVTHVEEFGAFVPPRYVYDIVDMSVSHYRYDGYDICTDDAMAAPKDAMVIASIEATSGAPLDLNLLLTRYGASAPMPAPLSAWIWQSTQISDHLPAITPDNTPDATSGMGGCMIAWCRDSTVGPSTKNIRTLSLRYAYPEINGVITPTPVGAPGNEALDLHPVYYSGSCSYPDIAHDDKADPADEPSAIIVWQGRNEDACGFQPRKILAQYVVYDSQFIYKLWYDARYVAPGPQVFEQTLPLAAKSEGRSVAVCWYDWRTGDGNLAHTRLLDFEGDISWKKRLGLKESETRTAENTGPSLYGIYPNPIYCSAGSYATIPLLLPDAGHVMLRVYNIYGRLVAVLHEGVLSTGSHSIAFDPLRYDLSSGIYICALTANGRAVTRIMSIVR